MLYLYIIGQTIATVIAIVLIICLIRKMNGPNLVNRQMVSLLDQRVRFLEEQHDEIQPSQPNKSTDYKINSLVVLEATVEIPLKLIAMAYNQKIAFITLNEYYSMLNTIMNKAENDDTCGFKIDVLIPINNDDLCQLVADKITMSLNAYLAINAVYSKSMIEKFGSDDSYEIRYTDCAIRGSSFDFARNSVMQTNLTNLSNTAKNRTYQKYQKYSGIINAVFFPKYYTASKKES